MLSLDLRIIFVFIAYNCSINIIMIGHSVFKLLNSAMEKIDATNNGFYIQKIPVKSYNLFSTGKNKK
jgi:hypothetical protein